MTRAAGRSSIVRLPTPAPPLCWYWGLKTPGGTMRSRLTALSNRLAPQHLTATGPGRYTCSKALGGGGAAVRGKGRSPPLEVSRFAALPSARCGHGPYARRSAMPAPSTTTSTPTSPTSPFLQLPDRPNLRHLKDQARDMVKEGICASLSAAQFAIARRYGFPPVGPSSRRPSHPLQAVA